MSAFTIDLCCPWCKDGDESEYWPLDTTDAKFTLCSMHYGVWFCSLPFTIQAAETDEARDAYEAETAAQFADTEVGDYHTDLNQSYGI